jgi:hypothetical protein
LTRRSEQDKRRRCRRRAWIALVVGMTAVEAAVVARRRGSLKNMDTVVRCRDGHLFTTLWVPGASLKAIRLGWWRLQRCPVGRHWSLVTPVEVSIMTDEEIATAGQHHDIRIP